MWKTLVISDQLIPGRGRYGACFDVFEMTKVYGSEYYESEFKNASIAGKFDLLLLSGHTSKSSALISIDGVDLVIPRDLTEVRCRLVYLNACHAGNNELLLEQCFSTVRASHVVAPVEDVPWGNKDNQATLLFFKSLLKGFDAFSAVRASDSLWSAGNPYRVYSRMSGARCKDDR